jgi:hypothetical protein
MAAHFESDVCPVAEGEDSRSNVMAELKNNPARIVRSVPIIGKSRNPETTEPRIAPIVLTEYESPTARPRVFIRIEYSWLAIGKVAPMNSVAVIIKNADTTN